MKNVAWLLNLDAELELAQPNRAQPSTRLRAQTEFHGKRFLNAIADSDPDSDYRHQAAACCSTWDHLLAWCPTPEVIDKASVQVRQQAPDLACLQHVNHRAFAWGIAQELPNAIFARDMKELMDHLQACRTPEHGWLLKRAFGFSGRWRKHLRGSLDDASRAWCEASMHEYGIGLQVEPYVDILAEFTLHGLLDSTGSVLQGQPTRLYSDPKGAWIGNQKLTDSVSDIEKEAFQQAFTACAQALHGAGYSGPFGIDGFRWRDTEGNACWQSLSDLNARFTMGYFVGMHHHHQRVIEACDLSATSQGIRSPGS